MKQKRGPRSADERVQGLLIMLPWLMQRGSVELDEMADHFKISRDELVRDLSLATLCGCPPYTPLEQIELLFNEDSVTAGPPRFVERPPVLSVGEGFALLAALQMALALPGADKTGALASAAEKLEKVLNGDDATVVIEIPRPEFLDEIKVALEASEKIAIDYFVPARGEVTSREVVPARMFTERGHWYLQGLDSRSGVIRVFRIDRIESVTRTGVIEPRPQVDSGRIDWFTDSDDNNVLVTLRLKSPVAWVVDNYPIVHQEANDDGTISVQLYATSEHWLGRLLIRLGNNTMVEQPERWRNLGQQTASAVLTRYLD